MTTEPFEQYVDLYERWFETHDIAYESELRAVASLLPHDGVGIEIGVGTGRFAAPLGIRLGVEPSAAMAAIARQRGIEVHQAVAESLPFADARFDFALMVTTLCFLDNVPLSLREAHRVLKDGGAMIVAFIDRESRLGRQYQSRQAESLFYRDARFYSVEEVARIIKSSGFEELSCVQTLFQDADRLQALEPVRPGHGEGSFVVLRGTKAASAYPDPGQGVENGCDHGTTSNWTARQGKDLKEVKTYFDCIPCMIRQALDSARLASEDEAVHERILRETLVAASELDLRQPPPAMAQRVHRRIRELTGKDDPYSEVKDRQNRMALEFYERFRQEVSSAHQGLEMAVRLAIAGNVIDLGVKSDLDESQIRKAIETCLTEPLEGDIQQFAAAIAGATRILYLTDNAGEIVLDRLLIEQLPREKVTVAVKGAPVINDATLTDAETAGITGLVTVIDNGSDAPGTMLEDCSGVFRRHFAEADLIIAKGQGNYETLREVPGPLYFLLRVKCPVLARDLGCPIGRMVLRPSSSVPCVDSER